MLTIAYLSFFTAEIMCHCSGIIAVVFCGLTTKAWGATLLNDARLTRDFWHTTEHLLNTILFVLGGAVWATAGMPPSRCVIRQAHSLRGR